MEETQLSSVYKSINLDLPAKFVDISEYSDAASLYKYSPSERIGSSIMAFVQSVLDSSATVEKIDRAFIDSQVAWIDKIVSEQLDAIMHNPEFQKLESSWRALQFLVQRTDFRRNVKIELISADKESLKYDFEDSPEVIQSGLYRHIYSDEYDTPGGEPYAAMIANYEFENSGDDIDLLKNISSVSAAAHCLFISSVGSKFFGKSDIGDLPKIDDLENYMERAEFTKWKGFRKTDDARYIGLVLPRFLLRNPYGEHKNSRGFNYTESVLGEEHEKYLWGNAAFAFAVNMVRSFQENGWCVQIRGPESGGKVEDLPIHFFNSGKGAQTKIPTEILIPETREFEFAKQGFIPLSFYKNRSYACFFSANSAQKPEEYDDAQATANSRVNSRLPYIFLTARLAHYLKVLQRENIGTSKSAGVLEAELNNWIKELVTEMKNPGPELAATHPLSFGQVTVAENPDNPGFFKVILSVIPHFQVEGVNVNLSLVSKMPAAKQ
ncbi:MAG: type VI secretion system contractile sheath large subunit [Fibromonadaceae bacterium]|jgi:type VI secretion system protein ImpC|nr:type VI secretion system contractile sheath large subunit [Fibromonadaceae bacterium]